MTLTKSILLSTAAGFVAVAGAQAADLPSRKAAPVNYVRICDAYGAGFFFIPGTETCLRVGGYVRVEYMYVPGRDIRQLSTAVAGNSSITQFAGQQDETGLQVRGRVDLDARTQTAWGTAQTVVRLRGANSTGLAASGGGTVTNVATLGPGGNAGTAITMERAFIRFAGFSFGVAESAFTTMPSFMLGSFHWAGFPNGIRTISYTATLGGGFSATVAIENRYDFNMANTNANAVVQPAFIAASRLDTAYNLTGNVRVDQSWGAVQLSGTVGNNSLRNGVGGIDTSTSWAVALGVRLNLPMLAAGDRLDLVAAYADGQVGALGSSSTSQISQAGWGRFNGGVQMTQSNMIATSTVGGVTTFRNTKGYSFGGVFTHYWTPSLRSHFAASYSHIMPANAIVTGAGAIAGQVATTVVPGNSTAWAIGGNLIWSPVRQLDLGVELYYANVRTSVQGDAARFPAWVAAGRPGSNVNNWGTKLRIDRAF